MIKSNIMTYEIKIKENNYSVIITKKKIKRIIIRINYKNEILVSAPFSLSYSDALNKVFLNNKWIEKTIEKYTKINEEFLVNEFLSKKIIYIQGNKFNIIKDESINSLYFKSSDNYFYKNNLNKAIDEIYNSFYYLIEEEFINVLNYFKKSIKQNPTLAIRKMKSRLGSCNYNTGKILINKMLICVPNELLKYVVVHEFCHLIYPNHSKDFYNLLGKILPNYKNSEKLLKKYSFLLTN